MSTLEHRWRSGVRPPATGVESGHGDLKINRTAVSWELTCIDAMMETPLHQGTATPAARHRVTASLSYVTPWSRGAPGVVFDRTKQTTQLEHFVFHLKEKCLSSRMRI